MAIRHFIDIDDFDSATLRALIASARDLKAAGKTSPSCRVPPSTVLALMFDKPSTRTRVSFDVAMRQLGGETLVLNSGETQLGRGETIPDTARVLSRYVDAMMLRTGPHSNIIELAKHASVPVINALSDLEHPCQIMADLLTIYEHKNSFDGLSLTYIGDGNNVARSLCLALPAMGINFTSASPQGYNLDDASVLEAQARANGSSVRVRTMTDPVQAVAGADMVYTDVWASMGQENETQTRQSAFQGYTVDSNLMQRANPSALFMHDMPAHYGEEVPPGMLDHPSSVAFQQAHNRLHAQKTILEFLLSGN